MNSSNNNSMVGDKNKGDGVKIAAATGYKEGQGQKKPEEGIPNEAGNKLSVETKNNNLDEPRDAIGVDHGSEYSDCDSEIESKLSRGCKTDPSCLPEKLWEKILEYVGYEDLKSLRGVCAHMKTVVIPNWTRLVRTSRLIFDGNLQYRHPWSTLADLNEIFNSDLIQGIFTHFCIRYVDEKYIPRNCDWGDAIIQAQRSVKTLDLINSRLNWKDVLYILNYFDCLENFNISLNPVEQTERKFISTFLDGLEKGLFLGLENLQISKIPTLKTVSIEFPFMQCVNVVLQILEYKCENLESLSLTINLHRMRTTTLALIHETLQTNRFDTGKLLQKNAGTFKKFILKFSLGGGMHYYDPISEYFAQSYAAVGTLLNIFDIRGLTLEELNLDIPMYFLAADPGDEITNQKRESVMGPFQRFLEDQSKSLKILKLPGFGWYPGADQNFQKEILGESVNVDLRLMAIVSSAIDKPNWTLLKDKMESLQIRWKGSDAEDNSFSAIFKGDTDAEPFEKLWSFSLYNHLTLADLDLPFILAKFPNMTCLKIMDLANRNEVPLTDDDGKTETGKDAAKSNFEIHDCSFQLILEKLPNLHTLHLDCDMKGVTDFGLTGISEKAQARMKGIECYRIESGDKTGHSLSRVKKLISLKMNGLEENVTDASVWLALRNLPLLKEIVFIGEQNMSETAKLHLKCLLEKRNQFYLEIRKPIKQPTRMDYITPNHSL